MSVLNELSWSTYEYKMTKFEIDIKGKKTTLTPGQVRNIYIEKDYDELSLPIFMVKLLISSKLYHSINQYHDDTKFTIIIHSQKRAKDGGTATGKSVYLSDIFIPLGIDSTPNTDPKEKSTKSVAQGNTLEIEDFANEYTFILGKKDNIKTIRKIVNDVLSSSNMLNAVSYLLSSCGVKKVLMSKFDNNTSYNELILLPIPMIEQLAYLNSMYGFYKEGAQIFFDFDKLYILRNCSKCTAYEPNEIKDVSLVIYQESSGKTGDVGSTVKDKKGYIHAGTGSQFHIEDQSKSSDVYMGNNSLILNDDASSSSAISNSKDGSYNIITTTTHNKFYKNEIQTRLKELSGVVTVMVSNIDLKLLAPNKCYHIISDDSTISKQVKSKFRLSKTITIFAFEGDAMSPVTTMVLKKSET